MTLVSTYTLALKLKLDKSHWKIIKNNGKFSLERSGHSSFIYKDLLYVFGGLAIHNGKYLNDIGVLDLKQLKAHYQDGNF